VIQASAHPKPDASPLSWSRATLVLNRESGAVEAMGPEWLEEEMRAAFREHGIDADVRMVTGAELQEALASARDDDSEVVLVGGGDGTVSAAVSLLAGSQKPLGVLPLGTYNLAARDLGVPLDWRKALTALLNAPVKAMDLLEVNGELYCCVCVLGFFPALKLAQPEHHGNWMVRMLQTARLALHHMATDPPLDLTLMLDGAQLRRRTRFMVIANNDYEELFGLIPRRTGIDGGFFTVYLSKHRTRWGMAKAFLSWVLGRFKQNKEITVLQTTELDIAVIPNRMIPVMVDGEVKRLKSPLRVRTRPKALKVLAPSTAGEP
jgi:diacylglycerol kinase family enzyme